MISSNQMIRAPPASLPVGAVRHAIAVSVWIAIALWFTERRLQAQANWSRISTFILLGIALLPSLLLVLSLHSIGRLLMITLIVLCALGMHALWMGYTPQPH